MNAAPRILFVPVTGPSGAGEYYESLALASGVRAAWPNAEIQIIVNRTAHYANDVPYKVTLIDDSPTMSTPAVVRVIETFKPHLAVFISAGRVRQFRAARQAGARVVYMSQRPNARARGFWLRRMRFMDQHWIAQPRMQGGELTCLEKLRLRAAPRVRVVFFDGLHEIIDAATVRHRQAELGLRPGEYVLLCPGGGGRFGSLSGPEVFVAAARQLADKCSHRVVVVMGPNSAMRERLVEERIAMVPFLSNGELMGLLRDARLSITNGGTLLPQAIMQGTPCIAVPIAGDQQQRIAPYVDRGMAIEAKLNAHVIADTTMRLLNDERRLNAMHNTIANSGLTNGVPVAVRAIADLLNLPLESDPR